MRMIPVLSLFLFLSPDLYAEPAVPASVQEKMERMMHEITALKERVKMLEGEKKTVYLPPVEKTGKGISAFANEIQLGGYLETQWNNNFRQPRTPSAAAAATNVGRFLDANDGSFVVNAVEITAEKTIEAPNEAGFRVDVQFGQDAALNNSDGDADLVDLQQAYAVYRAPLDFFEGNSILPASVDLTAGRFAALAGVEVIEGPDNWNISRSYAFALAVPSTMTGIRTNFGLFQDKLDVIVGLNNGWNLPVDNNSFKTLEAAVGYDLGGRFSAFHSFYWGSENPGTSGGKRWLLSHVLNWSATDKLSFIFNFDYGQQHNTGVIPAPTADADWYGFSGYTKYQFTDKLAVAYRAEFFVDDEVFRTTGLGTAAGTFSADRLFGQTLTAEYKLTDNLITRAEFRHDKANDDPVFTPSHSSQTTLGAQAVYLL